MAKSHATASGPVPQWVRLLALPVWVCASDGTIRFINAQAEALLSTRAVTCLGMPCHVLVAGKDQAGRPLCGPQCPILRRTKAELEIEPVLLEVARTPHDHHWVQLLVIPVRMRGQEFPVLVHCALPFEREHRIEKYLNHVAARSASYRVAARSASYRQAPLVQERLTCREEEILELLTADRNLHDIALELHVSYVTVRNHVQHLLAKLGAHSIQEAVALHLMEESWDPGGRPSTDEEPESL